jgi:hypothetical protein
MSEMTSRRAETEGRRGSRIDTARGVAMLVGIHLNGQCSVQETEGVVGSIEAHVFCRREECETS